MNAPASVYFEKARESLAGAESEFVNERYNNCANRCYYACFQAAIHALQQAGIRPGGTQWGHDFVQGQFIGLLINRRKVYPARLRDILPRAFSLRQAADYQMDDVSRVQAARMLKLVRDFVDSVSRK